MLAAIEPATDQAVPADAASPWHSYRCPRCNAPVILRSGSIRTKHFAHASGLADPDCEEYFGGFSLGVGRHARGFFASQPSKSHVEIAALYFEYESDGPMIGIWVPPAGDLPSWNGYVEILAANTNRRLNYELLERGQFVRFPLADGQWLVRVVGDIHPAYVGRLVCGPASFESEITVFDAERVPGQVVGPVAPVRLGTSVWVITRDIGLVERVPNCLRLEARGSFGGWLVSRVSLPLTASVLQLREMQRWLRREIRPAIAKVWVDSPRPVSFTPWGAEIYAMDEGPFIIRSDQPVDLRIDSDEQSSSIDLGVGVLRAEWSAPNAGSHRLRVNNLAYKFLVLRPTSGATPSALEVSIGGRSFKSLYDAQQLLPSIGDSERSRATLKVRWASERLAELIQVQRASVSVLSDGFEVTPNPGGVVTLGNLGRFEWPTNKLRGPSGSLSEELMARAIWLLGVSLEPRTGPIVFGELGPTGQSYPVLRALLERSWPHRYAAHVAYLARQIKGLS